MATVAEEATMTPEEEGPQEEATNLRTVGMEEVATGQMMTSEESARRPQAKGSLLQVAHTWLLNTTIPKKRETIKRRKPLRKVSGHTQEWTVLGQQPQGHNSEKMI